MRLSKQINNDDAMLKIVLNEYFLKKGCGLMVSKSFIIVFKVYVWLVR